MPGHCISLKQLAQWELQEALSNKSCFFHCDQRTFQRKPQPARRELGRTSMLTAPAKGNILGLSKHSNWKQGPGIPHVTWARAAFFRAFDELDKQRTILRTIPTFPSAAMEIWALRPARCDCLLPLNHPSTPTTQRPSCDQPPLIPRSQKQNTPCHRRQQTAPTVHPRAWVGMVQHLTPCYSSPGILSVIRSQKPNQRHQTARQILGDSGLLPRSLYLFPHKQVSDSKEFRQA